jgi:polyisoprenoid-binding protein YceI
MQVHLNPSQTQVNFTLGDVLHTVHGVFKLKSGDLWFDSSSGQAGGQIVVNALSGESGSEARDSRMHKNILESAMFPDIMFAPDRIDGKVNFEGDSEVTLHGQLNIHGGTHELTVNVKAHVDQQHVSGNPAQNRCRGRVSESCEGAAAPFALTASVNFPVPYVKWGMKNPSTLFLRVKDTVEIGIQAGGELSPAKP